MSVILVIDPTGLIVQLLDIIARTEEQSLFLLVFYRVCRCTLHPVGADTDPQALVTLDRDASQLAPHHRLPPFQKNRVRAYWSRSACLRQVKLFPNGGSKMAMCAT
jgi:hypothetical protein